MSRLSRTKERNAELEARLQASADTADAGRSLVEPYQNLDRALPGSNLKDYQRQCYS